MNPPVPLDPERARRRAEVAKAWAHVIGRTAYVPMTAEEMEQFLLEQVHVLADTVNAELFDPSPAIAVGNSLVHNDFTGPESLQVTVEILAGALLLDSENRTDRRLAEKVVGLLSNLATGYSNAIRHRTLDQQEHIKQALLKSKREAERRERAATERFEEVFHASAIGMALTDMAGNFVQTNSALAHILECPESELAGRNVRDLFPPEDADDVVISYREVTEGIMPRIRERRRMVRHDGTIAWVYLVISLLRDVNGVPAYHVTMVENLSELQALQNQLGQQSVRDMLTGVANRQHFQSKLDAVLEGAGPQTSITLLHVGIDSFSVINNGLGHLAGDRMLQVVANELRGIVQDYNAVIGRVGGDEFAILIENTPDVPHYQVLIDQINERLAEPTFIGDTGVAVCVSIGVAKHTGRAHGRLDLLRAANSTMRRAKAVGKRQWEAHNVLEDAEQKDLFALTAAMPGAWEMGELDCEYQPVVDLADGRTVAVEVLLRWNHPTEGVIGHYRCRDMAESTGMSLTIGPWAAMRAAAEAAEHGTGDVMLRFRLTQMQSSDGNLAAVINRLIARSGLPPSRLEIALDARAVIANRGEAQSNLQALHDNGVVTGLHEFTGSQTEFALVEDEAIQSVILAGSLVTNRPDLRKPDSLLTKVTRDMVKNLRKTGATVSVVDVPTSQDAAWWHALGVTRGQGDFAGVPGDLESVLPERSAPSVNGA
ncbi:bifunctional diguanylate cyclase/phosphodiesterase [Kibdelosporangium aridum]|uniref:Bifunctional diguanylate cyclase/phosphodiesterase n=1 Tax=Kibdelosporangium aridum TaxID=2030 RepID=A0A428XTP2_KIBAR|nr:EAL domain-containing protein [Kibdelosporangium aridum]RSM58716.1 bifunctional diguanylate cyclase/phosphodiesterase [Kibdelosporangium aridum]